ncbi:hypothetical protein TKV_c07690 [Thermoanaerobacter kivui]|uniref:Uncharacterized protein n=1 Tax=Thermoanaerobacter kivui TaxID=2325 RepID=A0A097AQ86_THEKI|nr:hypothetical protein TKV_c07690 [Thermoanaerobacter kivui]
MKKGPIKYYITIDRVNCRAIAAWFTAGQLYTFKRAEGIAGINKISTELNRRTCQRNKPDAKSIRGSKY